MLPADQLTAAAREGDLAAVRHLLEADTAPDIFDHEGWSPLHLAAHYGHAAVVDELLRHGADVGIVAKNDQANTPLHAALAGSRDVGIVDSLLAVGADPNASGAGGVTPLHLAASRGDDALIDRLTDVGGRLDAQAEGKTPADIAEERGHTALSDRLRREAATQAESLKGEHSEALEDEGPGATKEEDA